MPSAGSLGNKAPSHCARTKWKGSFSMELRRAKIPHGYAEVVLTMALANPLEIPGVPSLNTRGFTVGRRLYRSGESEYYLDGHRCRLKDIQTLFEGTGLGPNSYAILEQGKMGQILSSKPAEQRALIEEAARITLFKSRRYSAEMKLEQAQQNLVRAPDIIREVVRQLNSLRRQRGKARRYPQAARGAAFHPALKGWDGRTATPWKVIRMLLPFRCCPGTGADDSIRTFGCRECAERRRGGPAALRRKKSTVPGNSWPA